ncbi:Biosynthetic arginine decarboxylase [Pontiella desulfatans]|uniref:Arginine decarboxylase n=1 Tax=Pontiella desulfatans TaxID=2750659 RepID=A0A6C2U3U7_PONDE|nr:biosynthetic arginine decarboxylase [Pontiella desulfatans]VGO14718.1 Biosynthetic arginine decarboxylase [Pontiella desulfatans]
MKTDSTTWSTEESADIYGIKNWGADYFSVSDAGEVIVHPHGNGIGVSLRKIVDGLTDRGLDMPVLLRFSDILDSRIKLLHEGFGRAIKDFEYQGHYRGVYPIKVNQQQQVLEEITEFGARYHHGLEAGSKPELIAALSYMHDPEAYLICNGYKDEEFVELGLYACKMGLQCIFVVETPSELELIIDRSKTLDIAPNIGVRLKLSTQASGHWNHSGGERSVFGLNPSQVCDLVDRLKEVDMLDCLQLLHYHVGSQIPNIRDIREAVVEACRVYIGLVNEGAPMGILDLGGGLAVDYDGSHGDTEASRNYNLDEYCVAIVENLASTLAESEVPHPDIVTESGRATVAYYSVLLFNILDESRFEISDLPTELPENAHELLHNLMAVVKVVSLRNAQECFHDAFYYRDEIHERFKRGTMTLRDRALAGSIFWHIITRVAKLTEQMDYIPNELRKLPAMLADIYYGNFSLFQSLPDVWAIDQLFPVMPIHRLDEKPTREVVVADITCDCDGKIDRFVGQHTTRDSLPLHNLTDEEYYLGVFLVGAYQETLGDLHNLLGDTNVITVEVDREGHLNYSRELEGDSVADVLSYVEYDPKNMIRRIRKLAETAVRNDAISAKDRRHIMDAFESGMRGYTYFER